MGQTALTNGLRLSVEYIPTGFPELSQFGLHTGRRDPADYALLTAAMGTFVGGLSGLQAPCTITAYVISEWSTGPGFTGWHQVYRSTTTTTAGGGDMLPHQLTLVVGVNNLTEPEIALGRRRNRSNIGPLRTATMDTSGRSTTTTNSTLGDQFVNLQNALQTIPSDGSLSPLYDGLCVASPTEGVLMEGNQLRVGRRYDILRSRAEKTPETPTLITLE